MERALDVALLITMLNIDLYLIYHRVREYKISAETDHLRGLANRRAWERQIKKFKGQYTTCNVLILDIDHFKQINDQYGHANGKSENLCEMIRLADDCLYQAKNSGRNRTHVTETIVG